MDGLVAVDLGEELSCDIGDRTSLLPLEGDDEEARGNAHRLALRHCPHFTTTMSSVPAVEVGDDLVTEVRGE